jgi:polyhydroxybutyrate depolymerase
MSKPYRFLRRIVATYLSVTGLYFTSSACAEPLQAGLNTLTVESEGKTRSAQLYLPLRDFKGQKPALLVLLHGGGGSAKGTLEHDGWASKSEQQGFIIVAPEGLGIRPRLATNFRLNPAVWNSGQFGANSATAAIDDVAFIRKLLDTVKSAIEYDESKVFVTGHSNGGGMTFRLGAELSEKFAAMAMVAGRLGIDNPRPAKALPTLYIVGTADPLMPLEGGEVKSPWSGAWSNRPVGEQLSIWAQAIRCEGEPRLVSETELIKTMVYPPQSRLSASASYNAPALTVIYLKGHGHQWPGAKQTLPTNIMGPIVNNINASDVIWNFFSTGKAP